MSSKPRESGAFEDGYYMDAEDAAQLVKCIFRLSNVHRMQVELMTPDEAFSAGIILGTALRIKADLKLTADFT